MKLGSLLAIGALLTALSLSLFGCASFPPPEPAAPQMGSAEGPTVAGPSGNRVPGHPSAKRSSIPLPSTTRPEGLLDLMPYPVSVERSGGDLRLLQMPNVIENAPSAAGHGGAPTSQRVDFAVSLLRRRFADLTGRHGTGGARLVLDWRKTVPLSLNERESYSLVVRAGSISIDAPTDLGILHGIATLSQLLSSTPKGAVELPYVVIHDHPRFRWRGLMLDCVRHFMPVATIKRTLLGMAAVKLNVFHWHLSDDQGFRIESKLFPRLTTVGSDGQYYTQAQVREVVHFADLLGIRVVPEFDMPAHTSAVLAAYPSLGAGKGPYHVQTGFGVFNDVMDPTRQSTYRAIRRFLTEMTGLFPDRYVHIGGDENNYRQWSENPRIRAFMSERHMKTYSQLSQYFTSRVEGILKRLHRRGVVWEEAWNGRRDPGSVVQVWARPGLIPKAVSVGQPVIRSERYYLDLLYPASYHYVVDPADGTSNSSDVLGGEAAMWTELVSPANLASRLWPRLAAIAERFWSPASRRSVQGMYARLPAIDNYLASIGMRQYSDERAILTHLAGGDFSAPLQTLASVLQPLEGYGRISTMHYTTATPLDRMVDAIPPESVAGRRFTDLTNVILRGVPLARRTSTLVRPPTEVPIALIASGAARRAAFREARIMLARWRYNNARLQGLFSRQADLGELVLVSANLSRVARAGLAAIDRLERFPAGVRPRGNSIWLANELDELKGTRAWNRAQVTIAIEGAVRRLVYAASGLEPPLK